MRRPITTATVPSIGRHWIVLPTRARLRRERFPARSSDGDLAEKVGGRGWAVVVKLPDPSAQPSAAGRSSR